MWVVNQLSPYVSRQAMSPGELDDRAVMAAIEASKREGDAAEDDYEEEAVLLALAESR